MKGTAISLKDIIKLKLFVRVLTWVKPQRLSWNCEEMIETKHINQPDADDQPSEVLTNIEYTGQVDGEQNSCD